MKTIVPAFLFALAVMFACGYRQSSVPIDASSKLPECTVAARASGNDIVVHVIVANHTTRPYRLLYWNLPKSGKMTSVLFQITRNGTPVEYRGIMMKREDRPTDFISIPPGRSFGTDIPLLAGYDVRPSGKYVIAYAAYNPSADSMGLDKLISEPITLIK